MSNNQIFNSQQMKTVVSSKQMKGKKQSSQANHQASGTFGQRESRNENMSPLAVLNNQLYLDSTEFNKSSNYNQYQQTVSTFDKNFVISETVPTKQIAATYLKLSFQDLPLIAEAISNNSDQLRLFFGCKALRKILSTGSEYTIKQVLEQCEHIGKRLVNLLMMPQNHQELQIEILWSLVNLTSVKDSFKLQELIEFGLFEAVLAMLDENLESLEKCELSLTVMCNCIAD